MERQRTWPGGGPEGPPMANYLLAYFYDRERIRHHRTASRAAAGFLGRIGRWRGAVFGRDDHDVAGLVIERLGLSADHRLQVLFHLERSRILLFYYGQRAIAVRTEGFHGLRIESGSIARTGQRQRGDQRAG